MTQRPLTAPNCNRCKHYFVTWEPLHPYGCRAFGIKSKALPSIVIERESGEPCRGFEPKPPANHQGSSAPE